MLDDICPKWSSRTTMTVAACENHEPMDGLCESCQGRWVVSDSYECQQGTCGSTVPAYSHLWSDPPVIGWFQERDIVFAGPTWETLTYTIRGNDAVIRPIRSGSTSRPRERGSVDGDAGR